MKVGVIGCGSIGSRHAFNLRKLGHEVLGYDPSPHITNTRPLKEVLDKADAFVVASPIISHYDNISYCKERPTFVEKPLTHRIDEGLFTGNIKMVGYNLRFHSCVLQAKTWIDAGHLGSPLWANFVCGQKNKKYKEHVILNWSHEIDVALHLIGPADVVACAGNQHASDLIIRHPGNNTCQSTIHLDYLTEPEVRQFIIVGNKASIIATLAPQRVAWLRDASGTMLDTFQGQDDWDDNYVDEIESFIARCEGMDTVGATAEDGLAVSKICLDAIERSQNENRHPRPIDDEHSPRRQD